MKLFLGATTDPGRRPNNEDFHSAVTGEDLGVDVDAVLIVADGMGGRNFGEHASETAVDVVKATLAEKLTGDKPDHPTIKSALELALHTANDKVFELSQRDAESEGMGTTCVIAIVAHDRLHLGHAGDSRAYVIHNKRLELLTDDHSFVAEQVRAGVITEEGARKSKFRNVITRAVGIEPTLAPDIAEYPAEAIDAIMLCSDGLTNMVSDRDIERVLLSAVTPQIAADKLVRMAKVAGGSDNITAVVARLSEGPIIESATTEDDPPDDDHVIPFPFEDIESPGTIAQPSRAPLTVVSVLLAVVVCITLYAVSQLTHDGFQFRATPPFLIKPAAPKPPPPLNLGQLSYGKPVKVYPYPVRPEPLALSAASKTVTMVSMPGDEIVRISLDGTTLFKFPRPGPSTIVDPAKPQPVVPTPPAAPRHYATDRQGDVYISDAAARAIYKLGPTGELTWTIAGLQKPESIAVDDTGNIYVIDASTLKLIPATPAG